MTLVDICERKKGFILPATKKILSRKTMAPVGGEFHMSYPRESWTIFAEDIVRAARKRGISSREYNAYTKRIDDTCSPIQARIQLWKIPKELAREEEKRSDEMGIDGLYEAMGY